MEFILKGLTILFMGVVVIGVSVHIALFLWVMVSGIRKLITKIWKK